MDASGVADEGQTRNKMQSTTQYVEFSLRFI